MPRRHRVRHFLESARMSCSQYSGSGCTAASCLLKYPALTFTALIKVNSMFVTTHLSIYNIIPQLGTVLMCENIFRYHRTEKRQNVVFIEVTAKVQNYNSYWRVTGLSISIASPCLWPCVRFAWELVHLENSMKTRFCFFFNDLRIFFRDIYLPCVWIIYLWKW